jgi:putative chitinase
MSKAEELTKKYKTLLDKYGVNTPLRLAHFWGQLEHESGIKPIQENLNYSYEGLLNYFKSDFDTNKDKVLSQTEKKVAELLARKPEQIANFIYANQNGNGGVNSGDGWKYRGRFYIQITGKENYKKLQEDTGIDFLDNPDKHLNEVDSLISALWYWKTRSLNKLADLDDVKGVTKKINGGYNHLAERVQLVNKYKQIFK